MREFSRAIDPAIADDEEWLDEFIWMHRLSASPSSAAGFARMAMETDVTDVLASIRVPSLILHTADERGPSRYVAERIHDAQIAEVGGKQRGPYSDAVAEACLPSRGVPRRLPFPIRSWRRFSSPTSSARRGARPSSATSAGARSSKSTSARFAGNWLVIAEPRSTPPATASSAASTAPRARSRALGGSWRTPGASTSRCGPAYTRASARSAGQKLAGIAVHVGARVMAAAAPGEVLVSSTVKDLVAGSDFAFADRGEPVLEGVPGRVRLYAVVP